MSIIKKIAGKLYRNFKILGYSLFTKQQKRFRDSKSELIWNRTFAVSCGAYPIYFPRRREITDTFWGNIFLLTRLFMWMSYRNINERLEKNNSIYVSLNEMGIFMKQILPKINQPFVLVTGDSDYPASRFKEILENEYLVHWFAQNNDLENKMITALPIGMDFHSLLAGSCFGEKRKSAEWQEIEFEKIKSEDIKEKMKVYANFHLSLTDKKRREGYILLRNNSYIYFQKEKLPRTKMWKLQKQFMFNFSPAGAGMDCHRTWESLLLGQIPIVERTETPLDELYKQFPVVVIDNVSEINEKNLKKWHKKYSKMFNADIEWKLTNDYWVRLIRKKRSLNRKY